MSNEKTELKTIEHIGPLRNPVCYFGNIWIRSHKLMKGQDNGGGHTHHFDHVTMLASGKVLVEVDGHTPKEFIGPTFMIIKKEHKHKITALSDDVVFYCVFALRDINGEVTDIYSGDNSPYDSADSDEEIQKMEEKLIKLDHDTTQE